MTRLYVEPFSWYTLGGKPWLAIKRNPKWSHVHWGDGTLFHYMEFDAYIRTSGLDEAIHTLFHSNISRLQRRSMHVGGGLHGSFTFCPCDLAEEVFGKVKAVFTEALQVVEQDVGHLSPGEVAKKHLER